MRVVYCSLFLMLLLQDAFSQCNVKKFEESNYTFVTHAQESIFEYVDSQGGVMMSIEFAVRQDKQTQKVGAFIIVESIAVGDYALIVPRTMTIYFSNNSEMELEANSLMDLEYNEGVASQKALFFIMDDQRKSLGSNDVKLIVVSDPRKNKEIKCNPYKALLKEQVTCVFNNL